MLRRILIAVGVVLAVLALAGGMVANRFAQDVLMPGARAEMPDEMKVPRVVQGADRFSKQVFYSAPDLGLITDMEPRAARDLVIVGQHGAVFFKDGAFARSIHFPKCYSYVVAVELDPGVFLCRGGWSEAASLYDSEGKIVWSYNAGSDAIDDAAAGRLGPGGTKGVVVGLNGDGGVHWLSPDGKRLWKQGDGNVWHVEITAADDNSESVIVHSNAGGQLTTGMRAAKSWRITRRKSIWDRLNLQPGVKIRV